MNQAIIKLDKQKKDRLNTFKTSLSLDERTECKKELDKNQASKVKVFLSPNTNEFEDVIESVKAQTKYRDLIDESVNVPVRILDNHFYKDTYSYLKQLKSVAFDRHAFKPSNRATIYLCNEIVNALLDYDTHYTILKMNAFYHTLKKYIWIIKNNTLKTTNQYKVPRYINIINFESIELINESTYILNGFDESIVCEEERIKTYQSILLYPFQVALPTNKETTFKKELYAIKTKYTIGKDFVCDWLYYNTSKTILRMRIKHILTLSNDYTKLPFQDIFVLAFMRVLTFNNSETKTLILNGNYIALLDTEIIDKQFSNIKDTNHITPCFFRTMNHSKLIPSTIIPIITPKETKQRIKYSSKYKTIELKESVYTKDEHFERYINHNCIKHRTSQAETDDEKVKIINEVLNDTTDKIDVETLFYTISDENKSYSFNNQVISNYLINLLDAKYLSLVEIDALFNPKQISEPQIKLDTPTKQLTYETTFKTESSSDEDEEEEPSQDTSININKQEQNTPKEFSLVFEYNKYYDFSECKATIETSFINKFSNSSKLQELCSNYSIVKIIKPINKSYTNQTYFNFILTTYNNSLISQQYHSYLTDGEISSITQITNIL
jgi:hypothetical protein